jgi:hypothetical protein
MTQSAPTVLSFWSRNIWSTVRICLMSFQMPWKLRNWHKSNVRKSAKHTNFLSPTTAKIAKFSSALIVLHYRLKYFILFSLAQRAQVSKENLGKERIRKAKYPVKKYAQLSQI